MANATIFRSQWLMAYGLWLLLVLAGCSTIHFDQPGGKLAVSSQGEHGAVLEGGFGTGIYSYDNQSNVTVLLLDGTLENPRQAVAIRMFWVPTAGKTPFDPTATNATIRYIIFTGKGTNQAGLYNGAGFLYPKDYPGGASFTASVWEANLLLKDASRGFVDLLGKANLRGSFSARRDDGAVNEAIRRLNILVRQRLGYPAFVSQPSPLEGEGARLSFRESP